MIRAGCVVLPSGDTSSNPEMADVFQTMTNRNLQVLRVRYLDGPNIWTYRPVIEAWVDIHDLEDAPSNLIPGLYERLIAWLPGLIEHRCGIGERGGFLERLSEGTWAAHILEHVVIELHGMAGVPEGFGKARMTPERGIYKVAFRSRTEVIGRACLDVGLALLQAAIDDTPFDVAAAVAGLRMEVDKRALGPSTACIVDAAYARRIPSVRLTGGNLIQMGYGVCQRRIWTAETDRTSAIAEGIASDKDLTKRLISACGIPVPAGEIADSAAAAWAVAEDIGLPVVVKPTDGNHGRRMSVALVSERGRRSCRNRCRRPSGAWNPVAAAVGSARPATQIVASATTCSQACQLGKACAWSWPMIRNNAAWGHSPRNSRKVSTV